MRKKFLILVLVTLLLICSVNIFSAGEPSKEVGKDVLKTDSKFMGGWEFYNATEKLTYTSYGVVKQTGLNSFSLDNDMGGQQNYKLEDGKPVHVLNAKSLVGTDWIPERLLDDKVTRFADYVDWNATDVSVKVNLEDTPQSIVLKNVKIPLKVAGVQVSDVTFSEVGKSSGIIQIHTGGLGVNYSVGFNSTVDAVASNNGTFEEAILDTGKPTRNNGGSASFGVLRTGGVYTYKTVMSIDVGEIIGSTSLTLTNFTLCPYLYYASGTPFLNITQLLTTFTEGTLDDTVGDCSFDYNDTSHETSWLGAEAFRGSELLSRVLETGYMYQCYELNTSGVQQLYDDDGGKVNTLWVSEADGYTLYRSPEYTENYMVVHIEWVNTAPSDPVVTLSPLDSYSDVDTYCVGTVNDSDVGDTLTVDVEVFKGNVSQFKLENNPASNNVHYNFTIDSANFSVGDEWGCGMRVYDGTVYNPIGWVNATQFTVIQNRPSSVSWDSENPSNDTHYNLSELPATFYFQVSDADAGENIVGCHLSDGTTNYQSLYSITEGTNYSLNVSSFAAEGEYLMRINCDDGISNGTSSIKTIIYDTTPPDIPLISPAWPTNDNLSVSLDKTSVPFNISCTDINELWSFKINLSKNGVYYWGYYQEDINNTNFEYNTATDLSTLPNGSVLTEIVCYDTHTKQELRPYYTEKSLTEGLLSFHNSEDVIIIRAESKEGITNINTERLSDRYTFVYDFSDLDDSKKSNGFFSYDFLVYSTNELHYLEGSKENAHFVSLGEGEVNNWIDFNLKEDKIAKYKVINIGTNIWKVNIKTSLKSLVFESVGELNRADSSARFYLGDPFTLTSPYDDQVFLTDTVGFNCSFEESGTPANLTLVLDGVNNVTIAGTSDNTFLETNIILNEGYHNYTCTGTDSEGYFTNSSSVNAFTVSPNPPTVTLTTPPNNITTINLPANNSLVIASSGLFLDTCYYSTSDGTVNESYACNTTLQIIFNTAGYKQIDFCANDSYFREGCDLVNFTLTYISGWDIQEKGSIGEGDIDNILLFVNVTPLNATFTADSYLEWNNSFYEFDSKTLLTGGESYKFGYSFVVPNNSGTNDGNNVGYTFYFNVSEEYNNLTVNNSQLVYDLSLDDCTTNTLSLVNFSLKDEETKFSDSIENGTIKTTASVSNSLGVILQTSTYVNVTMNTDTNVSNAEQLSLCISSDVLNFSNYSLSLITEYEADSHVIEYYYIDDSVLSLSINLGVVSLYDLKTEDSTSFLITYKDSYYLPVNDAVIDVLRYYTEEGESISVEHGKTDIDGQTRLHLVAEDVLYKYVVRKGGEIIYITDSEGFALCLTTPCQINLVDEEGIIPLENIGGLENLAGSFDYDKPTRTITYTYATTDGSTASMNLDVILKNAYMNETVCSDSQISSAGTLTCVLPSSFVNTTFYANVSSGSSFVEETIFNDDNPAYTIHGSTGVLMTFFMFITLVFMAGSDAIGMLVFGILGLAIAGMLGIFGGGLIIGLGSSLLWLIVAVCIIIYKISQKKRS